MTLNMKKLLILVFSAVIFSFNGLIAQRSVEILPDVDTLYVCTDSTVQLMASEAFTYSWTPANIFDDATIPNPIASPTTTTQVIVEANVNGIVRRDTIVLIPATPSLVLESSTSDPFCAGEIIEVSAINNVGSQGLTWQIPTDVNVVDSLSGRLLVQPRVTATWLASINVSGCIVDTFVQIQVRDPLVTIENSDTVFLCKDSEVTLGATTNSGFIDNLTWSPAEGISATTGAEVIASPKETTTYYATLVEDGCTIVDSVVVRIDSLPTDLSIEKDEDKSPDPYCEGDIVTLKSPTYETGPYPIIEHLWKATKTNPRPGDTDTVGTFGFETPDTLFNLVFTAQDSAIFERVTRSGGCLDTSEVFIPVIKQKMITIMPEPAIICPGETLDLTAEFSGPGDITWTPEENITGSNDQKTVTVGPLSETTAFTIEVVEEGCPTTQSKTVELLPQLVALNTQTVICRGDNIELNSLEVSGAIYTWTSPDDPSINSNEARLVVRPLTNTQYDLTVEFGDCGPQTASILVNVIQEANVIVDPEELTICPGDPVELMGIGNAESFAEERYTWTFGSTSRVGSSISDAPQTNTQYLLTYEVAIPGGRVCSADQGTSRITVEEQPEILALDVVPEEATTEGIIQGDAVTITADIVGNTSGFTFQWMANQDNIDGTITSTADDPLENTQYKLTLTSPTGCELEQTSPTVIVIEPAFEVPNVFTPNDDDINDFFNIAFVGIRDLSNFIQEFQVFNRWGVLVYDNDTPDTGWDGRYNGNPAPADVYVYKIKVRFPDGTEEERSGEVTLIR